MSEPEGRSDPPRVYVRVDVFLDDDPAIISAGPWASVAFQALFRVSKRMGQRGHVRAAQLDGAFLARVTMFDRREAWGDDKDYARNEIDEAMENGTIGRNALAAGARVLVGVGLLAPCGSACPEGCHYLRSWDTWQRDPLTDAERQARRREKKATLRADADTEPPPTPTSAAKHTPAQKAYRRKADHLTQTWESATAGERAAFDDVLACWRATMRARSGGDSVQCRAAVLGCLRDPVAPRTAEQIKLAVVGCSKTPHNMGKNDRNTLYNTLDLICRNVANVDRFAAAANGAPRGPQPMCRYCNEPRGVEHTMGMHPACYEAEGREQEARAAAAIQTEATRG